MTVTLNINNDAELRAYIKESIKGQIVSVAREEIVKILQLVLADKLPTVDPDTIVKEEIKKNVKSQLDSAGWNQPSYIQKIAREEVQKIVKEVFKNQPLV